jgi:hypothetical protein
VDALDAQGAQDRDILSVVLGDRADDPLTRGGSAIEPGHRQIHPRFIYTRQAPEVERGNPLAIGR